VTLAQQTTSKEGKQGTKEGDREANTMKYKRLGDKRREGGEKITKRNKKVGGNKTIENKRKISRRGRERESE
jgi:hypothetical protein